MGCRGRSCVCLLTMRIVYIITAGASPRPTESSACVAWSVGRGDPTRRSFMGKCKFCKNFIDFKCDNNYNKGVAESEVKICHQELAGQKQRSQRIFGIACGSTWKLKLALKNIVQTMELQRVRQSEEAYICFCPQKNKKKRRTLTKNPPLLTRRIPVRLRFKNISMRKAK